MITIPFYLVDAFTSEIFHGNPAAVCPLDTWLPDEILLAMTREHNQSETAFFIKDGDNFELRWFTSQGEIDLCGHATLATAHVIFEHLKYSRDKIIFHTRFMGNLTISRTEKNIILDFPARPYQTINETPLLIQKGLNITPISILHARDYYVILEGESMVRNMVPNLAAMEGLGCGVCITARGHDCDFVSRTFFPGDAVPEDPVTGSTHCILVPYWSTQLGKTEFCARQLSRRGGEIKCKLEKDRVQMAGKAVTYLCGTITLPTA